jgi:hypothetical protein
MMGERPATILEVRPYNVHGVPHVELVFDAGEGPEAARLGAESIPDALAAGERVMVRSVMRTIVEVRRA